jgi:hypothetical protein
MRCCSVEGVEDDEWVLLISTVSKAGPEAGSLVDRGALNECIFVSGGGCGGAMEGFDCDSNDDKGGGT